MEISTDKPLSHMALRFVAEYLAHPKLNQTEAAVRAGYAPRSAHVRAHELMKDRRVQALITEKTKEAVRHLELTAQDVLSDIFHVVTADPNELTEYRVGCCRYCWGDGNQYQRTPREYREALAGYRKSDEGQVDPLALKFPHAGGVGFNANREPNPECPECFGDGEGRTIVKDTRKLSPAAKAMYAGVKETRYGTEVVMRSKDTARDLAARHTRVVKGVHEFTGPGGGPLQHGGVIASVQLTTSDPLEAAREYQKIMGGGA